MAAILPSDRDRYRDIPAQGKNSRLYLTALNQNAPVDRHAQRRERRR
jgi:hypothetical protein